MGARNQVEEPEKNSDSKDIPPSDTKKVIYMEQVASSSYVHEGPDSDVEEGDRIGNFEVTQIEEVKCDHPKVFWTLQRSTTEGELPEISSTCQVCGAKIPVEVGFTDGGVDE
jgi:DNA-directed RNA polymerase subunit M/transcription elongation factor TFIIS